MGEGMVALKSSEDVRLGELVWWKDGDGYRPPLRLGRVVGRDHGFLIVQIGPDRFNDILCRTVWSFYEVEPLPDRCPPACSEGHQYDRRCRMAAATSPVVGGRGDRSEAGREQP